MGELRIWSPEVPLHREDYLNVEDLSLKSPEFRKIIKDRTDFFTNTINEKWKNPNHAPTSSAETGQKICQALTDLFQVYSLKGRADQMSQLKNVLINCAPSIDQGRRVVSGAMAQYGVMESFKEIINAEEEDSEHLSLYPALPEEDLLGGTDFWINASSGIAYAVQVKVVNNRGVNNDYIYPISVFEDVSEQLLETDIPDLLVKNADTMEKADLEVQLYKYLFSLQNQVRLARKYNNVIPLIITIPSPYAENTVINSETGEPQSDFVDKVYDKFWDIHNRADDFLYDPASGNLNISAAA